ncbi:MAG: YigZ family protein [Halanaerobiales bacterium]|nr:YigZ family protein [Halanaerobiales bacterium]
MKSKIKIPNSSIEIKNKVKDSIFWGNIKNVSSKKEAENFINKIKEKYYDASHNVSAYVISNGEENIEYYDDDGEPSKSSGPPVLKTIKGADLIDTVVTVTRYFGGTELGIGGLIRAYGGTAKKAIEAVGIKNLKLYYYVTATGNYDSVGTILGQVEAFEGKIKNTKYSNNGLKVFFYLKPEVFEELKSTLVEKTGNDVKIKINKKLYL